jgi:hypothetical protein
VKPYVTAVRRAADVVDVPGAPRSLRLDQVQVDGDSVSLGWSFVDPEVPPGPESRDGRVHGTVVVRRPARGTAQEVARNWWDQAQLEAAQRYKLQIDADWIPGEPWTRREWTVEEAWEALLAHLGRTYGAEVRVEDGEIRVADGDGEVIYRIDPDEWAMFLNVPEATDTGNAEIVPAAMPLVDGLPLWVVDELAEVEGAWGPVVALVDGQLVGIRASQD